MRTVVVATSGSAACRRAVAELPAVFGGADLLVATAVPGADEEDGVRAALDAIAIDAARSLLARTCADLGPGTRAVLVRGDPVDGLCAVARDAGAQVIVVGSLGGGLGGGVGAALLRQAPCAVVELGG